MDINEKIKNTLQKLSQEKTKTESIAKKWIFIILFLLISIFTCNIVLIIMFILRR